MNLSARVIQKLKEQGALDVVMQAVLETRDAGYDIDAAKQKRIAFQSIFRTLCEQTEEGKLTPKKIKRIEKTTDDIVDRMWKKYKPDWMIMRGNEAKRAKKAGKQVKES